MDELLQLEDLSERPIAASPLRSPRVAFQRTLASAVSVVGGEVLLRVASFGAVVVMGRLYGPSTLGLYATTLAFATVAVMLAECGLQLSSITEIGRAPNRVNQVFGRLLSLRVILFGSLLLGLFVFGLFYKWEAYLWLVGGLVIVRTMLYSCSQLQFCVLKSLDRMRIIGAIQVLTFTLLSVGIAATYLLSWSFVTLLWCGLAAQGVEICVTLILLVRSGIRPSPFYPHHTWELLQTAGPIGATYLLAAVILRADVIVLSSLRSPDDVGRFAAADVGLVFVYAVSWMLGTVLMADQVRCLQSPAEGLYHAQHWRKVLFFAITPPCALLFWLAPWLTKTLYGPAFASTGRIASVMVLAVPMIFLNSSYLSRMIALGRRRIYFGVYLGTAIVAIGLNVVLGRIYGATGIAYAIVGRELLMLVLFWTFDGHAATSVSRAETGMAESTVVSGVGVQGD